jgi:hypothetical protein
MPAFASAISHLSRKPAHVNADVGVQATEKTSSMSRRIDRSGAPSV